MIHPNLDTLPSFYKGYVDLVKEYDLFRILSDSNKELVALLRSIPEDKGEHRYAPDKWTIKDVIGHMLDAERIFGYRALRFARNDKTLLAGFEENDYVPQAHAARRTLKQLANEIENQRISTIDLFTSFTPEMLERKGKANDKELSVVNIGFIIPGHETHHRLILQERYLTHS